MANTSGPFSMTINPGTFVNSRPAGDIAGSKLYLWYDGDRLGDGATGTVYVGREKATGDLCAIKTFNAQARKRSQTVQSREFEVLSKLRHVNIVKILAMEHDLQDESPVLVMELCTGGSLYSILEHPANQFGLAESEFLLVLEHVTSGMKHLRDNCIIHRDLKPGNIMRYVTASGESIYKLVDFGAARQLEDEEEFQSLYGTEEYLLPDMYESAVLDKHRKRQFGANCDLWSLGVTFYHAATGSLPFRPYGGRKNRHMMHHITSTKKSGVISGVQKQENGPIHWSSTLPTTCRLTLGLRELIRELLAGMLEPDATKMMKFDKYFKMVHAICKIVPVHVFNVSSADMLRIYSNPADLLASSSALKNVPRSSTDTPSLSSSLMVLNLQDAIACQTEVPIQDQILIYDGVSLDVGLGCRDDDVSSSDCDVGSTLSKGNVSLADSFSELLTEDLLVNTHQDNPIFVLPRSTAGIKFREPVVPKFDAYFPEVDLSADYRLAKQYCSVMYSISRQIQNCAKVQSMLVSVRKITSRSLKNALVKLGYFEFTFKKRLASLKATIQFAKTSHGAFSALCDASLDFQPQIDVVGHELKSIEKDFSDITDYWNTFREIAKRANLTIPYDDCVPKAPCAGHGEPPCFNTAQAIIEETTRIMNDFKADRSTPVLSFNTEQIHKYDKHRLNDLRERAMSKAESHCFFNTRTALSQFVSWYEIALELMCSLEGQISPMKTELDFKASLLASRLSQFHLKLEHIHKHILKSAVTIVKNGTENGVSVEEKRKKKMTFLLEKLARDQEENNKAVGETNQMLMSMTEDMKGLEIVDTSAAAFAIGGAESFHNHYEIYSENNSIGGQS